MTQKGRPVWAAFQFLSRFPVKAELDFTPELLKRSVKHYPLVGAAIGLSVSLGGALSVQVLPAFPAAVLALILWVWLTGGLHLDGWMDSADALLSYRSREKMLEIMKDSRVGAMGVLACVLLLLLKASLLTSLLTAGPLSAGAALLTAPVWSRWFMAWAMSKWPTAREGEGLAGLFRGLDARVAAQAGIYALMLTAVGLGLAAVLPGAGPGVLQLGIYFAAAPVLTAAAGSLAAGKICSKLGGMTGDTYGALNEGLEVLLLVLAVLVFKTT
ncbi:adenosylcobinamide-GDP ribazoletransferase [Paenibacillus sp. A14]|uniref:adenosylcobinamide-GDP ribazoletransferase n=1 Tax=Paenibacillus sp. A14 TaxID=3119820 RepID=UPI002FE3F1DA